MCTPKLENHGVKVKEDCSTVLWSKEKRATKLKLGAATMFYSFKPEMVKPALRGVAVGTG